jgi:hypothetical protein
LLSRFRRSASLEYRTAPMLTASVSAPPWVTALAVLEVGPS